MNDTQFDDYFNDKLKDFAAPVPAGLWDKVAEGQLDQFIGSSLRDAEAPVPAGLWDKISDAQFDNFIGDQLYGQTVPVSAGLWDKISDGQFDNFVGGQLQDHQAPVPADMWDRVSDGQFDSFIGEKLYDHTAPVPAGLWDNINDAQFDQFVAGQFKDHESPVPAGLWEKVKPEEDNDRVGFIWFRYPAVAAILIGVMLALGTWAGYRFYQSQKKNEAEQTIVNPSNKKGNAEGSTSTESTVTPEQNQQSVPVTPSTTVDATTKQAPAERSTTTVPATTDAGNTPDAKKVFESSSEVSVSGTAKKKSLRINGNLNVSPKSQSGLNLKPPADKNDLSYSSYDIFKNKIAVTHTNDNTIDEDNGIPVEPYQQNLLTAVTIPSGINKNMSMLDRQLSTLNHTSQFRNVIICPSDNKNKNTDLYLEAWGSPDLVFKSVSNVSATPLFLSRKDSSESMQISYSAGLRLVKPLTNNIILKTGIQYSQANEKYVYRTENEVKTTTVVTLRTIIRGPGDTVIVKDTSTLQTIGFKNNTVKNRYRSFDIPVTIGYQFGDDDLKFGINAGVMINLSSWYEGVILDSSLATVTLNKTGNNVYKTNIGIGLYGGVSVIKRLSDDMHIFFEPYFRYGLSNMTTSQSKYNQKFSVGGLAIGLRINLNRN